MNWLLFVSVVLSVGLVISVVVLGYVAIALTRGERQRLGGDPPWQGHLAVSKDDSTAKPTGLPRSMTQIGFQHPRVAFRDAFMKGDVKAATAILPELARRLGPKNPEYLRCAGSLAAVGAQIDLDPLVAAFNSPSSDENLLQFVVESTVQYYVSTDQESAGLDRIGEVLKQYVDDTTRSPSFRASVANQLQMLYLGVGDTANALDAIVLAIKLSPNEPSYYFNLSLVHEVRQDLAQAIEAIERCMSMKGISDSDHIFQAWDLYRQAEDEDKMEAMHDRLRDVGYRLPS